MIYTLLSRNFDVEIYALFPQFFVTEKQTPQTFTLLECMIYSPHDFKHFCIQFWKCWILHKQKWFRYVWLWFASNRCKKEQKREAQEPEPMDNEGWKKCNKSQKVDFLTKRPSKFWYTYLFVLSYCVQIFGSWNIH